MEGEGPKAAGLLRAGREGLLTRGGTRAKNSFIPAPVWKPLFTGVGKRPINGIIPRTLGFRPGNGVFQPGIPFNPVFKGLDHLIALGDRGTLMGPGNTFITQAGPGPKGCRVSRWEFSFWGIGPLNFKFPWAGITRVLIGYRIGHPGTQSFTGKPYWHQTKPPKFSSTNFGQKGPKIRALIILLQRTKGIFGLQLQFSRAIWDFSTGLDFHPAFGKLRGL